MVDIPILPSYDSITEVKLQGLSSLVASAVLAVALQGLDSIQAQPRTSQGLFPARN